MRKIIFQVFLGLTFIFCGYKGFATQYKMTIITDSCYTNVNNWISDSQYSGYPGTTIEFGDTVFIQLYSEIKSGEQVIVKGVVNVGLGIYNYGYLELNGGEINKDDNYPGLLNFGNASLISGQISSTIYNYDSMNIQSTVLFPVFNRIYNYGFLDLDAAQLGEVDLYNEDGGMVVGSANVNYYAQDALSTYVPKVSGPNDFDQLNASEVSIEGYITPILLNGYIPEVHTKFNVITSSLNPILMCPEVVSLVYYMRWRLSENNGIEITAIPKGSTEYDCALDFGTTNIDTNSYAYFQTDIGLARTIEFKFLPQVIDPTEPAGMLFNFGISGLKYIFQGSGFSPITGETLSFVNGGLLYIDSPFENRWYHISLRDSSGNGFYEQVFVDGEAVEVHTSPGHNGGALPECFDIDNFQIGARIGTPYSEFNYRGRIDDVRLWSVSRTPQQIDNNWIKALTASDTIGLEAYYTMNQGMGNEDNNLCLQNVFDFSGKGHHGNFKRFRFTGNHLNWVEAASCPSYVVKEINTFTGTTLNWFDPHNWSLGSIPSSCHHVIIPSGKEVIVDQPGAHCFTLEVEGSINTDAVSTLEVWAPKSE